MNELDELTILGRARAGLSPSPADQDRVHRTLALALAAPGATPPRAASGGSTGSRLVGWTPRVLVATALAASFGAGGYWAGYRSGRRTPVDVAAAVAAPPARDVEVVTVRPPEASEPPTLPASEPRRVAARVPRGSGAGASVRSASPAASLGAEVRALRAVERALRDGEPGLALALLRELDRAVPDGSLVEEREATAAIARCALGEAPFGVDLGRDFAERHPDSVYLSRVQQGCAAAPHAREPAP